MRKLFLSKSESQLGILLLLLIYPFLMFDGVRSIAAFILLMSYLSVSYFNTENPTWGRQLTFFAVLVIFSFSRADIALLIGLVCALSMGLHPLAKLLTAIVPLLVQYLLGNYIYPESEYYADVIMLGDNLSLVYFANNPATYLLLAVLLHWQAIKDFLADKYRHEKLILALLLGYVLTVFIVGRPNEFRLFLPLLPVILLLRLKSATRNNWTQPIAG